MLRALLAALLLASASAQAPCPAGTYSASGLDTNNGGGAGCTACPAGIFTAGSGSATVATCTICAPGFYGTVTSPGTLSAAGCTACPSGISTGAVPACTWTGVIQGYVPTCPTGPGCAVYTTLAAAQAACLAAPTCGGLTLAADGSSYQLRQGPGVLLSYPPTGETSLLIANHPQCRATFVANAGGSATVAACAVCAPGYAGTVTSPGTATAAGCAACAAGTYAPVNAGACIPCPAGTFSAAGAASCTPCPTGITTTGGVAGGSSVSACTLCAPGFAGTVTNPGTPLAAGCSICAAGTYAGAGQATCTACASSSSAGATACLFQTSSLLLLRVGDGAACPSAAGAAACSLTTAPIFLDEYSTTTGLKLQTVPLPTSISMGASDPFIGALSRCGDGSCVVFGGAVAAPPGTVGTAAVPYYSFPRPVVRISASGAVDASTLLPVSLYNGHVKGACSLDGSGYWVRLARRFCAEELVRAVRMRPCADN
jgi:syndecan 4